jgi:hypothetical protein
LYFSALSLFQSLNLVIRFMLNYVVTIRPVLLCLPFHEMKRGWFWQFFFDDRDLLNCFQNILVLILFLRLVIVSQVNNKLCVAFKEVFRLHVKKFLKVWELIV